MILATTKNLDFVCSLLKDNVLIEEEVRDHFFRHIEKFERAVADAINELEKSYLNERITIYVVTNEVLDIALLKTRETGPSDAEIEAIRQLKARDTCLFLFPSVITPVDLEEVCVVDENYYSNAERLRMIDGVLVSLDSFKNYMARYYGPDPEEFGEENGDDDLWMNILPLCEGRLNNMSNHLGSSSEVFMTPFDENDRETYGNIFDLVQLIYYQILQGQVNIETSKVGSNEFSVLKLKTLTMTS